MAGSAARFLSLLSQLHSTPLRVLSDIEDTVARFLSLWSLYCHSYITTVTGSTETADTEAVVLYCRLAMLQVRAVMVESYGQTDETLLDNAVQNAILDNYPLIKVKLHGAGCLFYFSAGAGFIDLAMVCAAANLRADIQHALIRIMKCYI